MFGCGCLKRRRVEGSHEFEQQRKDFLDKIGEWAENLLEKHNEVIRENAELRQQIAILKNSSASSSPPPKSSRGERFSDDENTLLINLTQKYRYGRGVSWVCVEEEWNRIASECASGQSILVRTKQQLRDRWKTINVN